MSKERIQELEAALQAKTDESETYQRLATRYNQRLVNLEVELVGKERHIEALEAQMIANQKEAN